MPTKIPIDFVPSELSLNNLAKHGALPEFIDSQIDYFRTYWTDTGKTKESWQSTLQVWMRRAWNGKAGREWENNRHQFQTRAPSTGNPFDEVIRNLEGNIEPPKKEPRYKLPPKPINTDSPMTSEQAFAELRKQGFLK